MCLRLRSGRRQFVAVLIGLPSRVVFTNCRRAGEPRGRLLINSKQMPTDPQRGTLVLLLLSAGFADVAGGTPWPIGF